MKPQFNVGDILVRVATGSRHVVESFDIYISKNVIGTLYLLREIATGCLMHADDMVIMNFILDTTQSNVVPTNSSGTQRSITSMIGDIGASSPGDSGIYFVPIKIEIGDIGAYCDHDYVTWTGLHGTITDCTKCKKIKNDTQ